MSTNKSGFTIVELLIVIVVIAILAAISIVAYNGIQNRANDAAIQGDLSSIAKKVELFNVDNSQYPNGYADLNGLGVKATKSSYDTSSAAYNLIACRVAETTTKTFAFTALSKSGRKLYISNNSGGAKEYTGTLDWKGISPNTICDSVLSSSVAYSAGFRADDTSGPWRTWVN